MFFKENHPLHKDFINRGISPAELNAGIEKPDPYGSGLLCIFYSQRLSKYEACDRTLNAYE